MKKIFLTGGSGLLGHFLLAELLQKGNKVTALYRNTVSSFTHPNLEWVEGDILDPILMGVLISQVEEVYHSAGFVSYAPQDIGMLQQINVEGTENIVNACLENPGVRLCHVSSIAAINRNKGEEMIDETAKWDPGVHRSAYATSKYFAELEVWRGISEGLLAVIVNPSIILGPGDWNRSSTQLFKYVADERPFYSQGYANFVDVRDVVAGTVSLMEKERFGERFIMNGHQVTYQYFFEEVAKALGKKAPSVKVPTWIMEVLWRTEAVRGQLTGKKPLITKETARIAKENHFYSNKKVAKAIGLQFRSLEDTIQWCCENLLSKGNG